MADGSSAQQDESFEEWLICRMRQLELDEDVFGSYVTGVLDSEDTDEDRKDALIGILEGMTVGTCTNCYVPVNSKTAHPPPGNPRAFDSR